jgi:hypothetical protein
MMSEVSAALEEALNRKADGELRKELDVCFAEFRTRVNEVAYRNSDAAPQGLEQQLESLLTGLFAALCPGARLRAAEKLIRSISPEG